MKYLLVFLVLVCIVLWLERSYWRRRSRLLELRLLKKDMSQEVKSLFDAWLDGRIEARLRKEARRD
jgi:hypothetical protein